ncbi:tRNA pseudouridine(55) synthase [hydrothermal vent metagenome]|uniref:tRNA pseudouridine(55) synthase n=1 Tax=hydrothermal vent metagenome TaxID=652676 RepID=A0A3B0WQ43_9ZZZZ
MGRRKNKGRNISGVLLLDKPQGGSSNHALQKVKRLFGAAKAGHTGSLDPLATGMLPVCFGEATKISAFLLDADKRYRLKCQLGVSTTTGDTEGEVVDTKDVSTISQKTVEDILPAFLGEIEQVPPMYSALKHNGERLYKLARQGIEVERKARKVTIYDIEFLALGTNSADQLILELEVGCSKGTYVRTLVEDIAKKLDCCAHITALRRLSVGPYEGEMMTMDQLMELAEQGHDALDESLQPVDSGVANWPDVHLAADAAFYVQQGQAVMVPHAPTQGWVRIYDQSQFLGLGEIQDDGMVAPRRMIKQCA